MLKIHFGSLKSEIKSPSGIFMLEQEADWFDDPFVLEMVQDVDNLRLITHREFEHPVFGLCGTQDISGGLKNLILAYKLNRIIDATYCGDNCAKWIMKIAEMKDLHITLSHVMNFKRGQDESGIPFKCYITNNHKYIDNVRDYGTEALKFILRCSK